MRVRARGLLKLRPSALRESEQFAAQQEGALLAGALLRSKIDMESGNEVVLLRLTSYSDEVHAALLESPELEACRAAVLEAGCDLVRYWGNGAKMFEEHFWGKPVRATHTLATSETETLTNSPKKETPQPKLAQGEHTPYEVLVLLSGRWCYF